MRLSATFLHNLAFVVAVGLVALLAAQGVRNAEALLRDNDDVRRGLELVTTIKDLRSALLEVETGSRGFLITGREEYLGPYRAGVTTWPAKYRQLAAMMENRTPSRAPWLRDLKLVIEERVAIAEQAISIRRETDIATIRDVVARSGGKQAMDQVRALLGEAEREELARLDANRRSVQQQYTQARRNLVIGSLAAAALLLATILAINLNLRTRRRLLASAKRGEARMGAQRAFLRTVVDADQNLIYVRHADGTLDLCNVAFAHAFQTTPDDIERKPPADDVVARAPEMFERDREIADGSAPDRDFEFELKGPDGRLRFFQATKRRMPPPSQDLVLTVAVDVSARREVERLKAEFVSTVSHELRTPLTSIRGALGMLIGDMAGAIDPQARPLLEIAHRSCERLVRLINDLLDIEKLESGRMTLQLQALRLGDVVAQALEQNQPYARDFGVSLESRVDDPGTWLEGDADRIAQILANLVSNAVKHSPRGETVTIDAARVGNEVQIGVRDRGEGIPDAFRDRIFERFSQADGSDARQRGGTGLGLAITKSLVLQHGGSIDFAPGEDGKGTRFQFRLPTTTPPRQTQGAMAPDQRPLILLVEDDAKTATQLAQLVQAGDYRTTVAATAARARLLLAREPVAAMMVSLALRREDALGLIREIRGSAVYRHLPIVAVGVGATEGSADMRGGVIGVGDWLCKPFDADRVVASIRACVDTREHPAHVLHVEDDAELRDLLVRLLRDERIVLHGAGTLAEARAELAKRHHQLVVLDLMLPDGDGADLIDELAASRPPIRVIVFSAREAPLPESKAILRQIVKSRQGDADLAALIHAQLQHWPEPAADSGSNGNE